MYLLVQIVTLLCACLLSLNAIYFHMNIEQKSTFAVPYCTFQMFIFGLLTLSRNWEITGKTLYPANF